MPLPVEEPTINIFSSCLPIDSDDSDASLEITALIDSVKLPDGTNFTRYWLTDAQAENGNGDTLVVGGGAFTIIDCIKQAHQNGKSILHFNYTLHLIDFMY